MHGTGELGAARVLRQLAVLRDQRPVIAGLGLVVEPGLRQEDDSLRRRLFDALRVQPKQRLAIITGLDQLGAVGDVPGLGALDVGGAAGAAAASGLLQNSSNGVGESVNKLKKGLGGLLGN